METKELKKIKTKSELDFLLLEIANGISNISAENIYLVKKKNPETGDRKYELNFDPASLVTPEWREEVVKWLLADLQKVEDLREDQPDFESILEEADMPEGCQPANVTALNTYKDANEGFVVSHDKLASSKLLATISGGAATAFGVIGLVFGITAAVMFGAAFPPLFLGVVIGCAIATLIGIGATAYFNLQQKKANGEADEYSQKMTKLKVYLLNSLERAVEEGKSLEPKKIPDPGHTESPLGQVVVKPGDTKGQPEEDQLKVGKSTGLGYSSSEDD